MNQKEGTRWELRLGVFQVVVLLGLIMGLLTCIFFLGFFSGRQVGHDAALSASLSNTIKMPIGEQDQGDRIDEESSKKVASEVYARLNESGSEASKALDTQKPSEMPRLGMIDSTAESPIDQIAPVGSPVAGGPASTPLSAVVSDEATALPSRDQLLKQVIELEEKTPSAAPVVPTVAHAATSPAPDAHEKAPLAPTPTAVPPTATVKAKETATPRQTPTPKPTKSPKAAAAGEQLPKGWFAQIAAPRKKEDASEISRQLRKSGFGVIVEVAQVRGEQYYRVLAGPESSKAQAEKLIEQLKREPYIQTQPFLRQIK